MSADMSTRPVILGAGPCGLALGLALCDAGLHPILIERQTEVGGLCRTFRRGPHSLDLSIHRVQQGDGPEKLRLLRLLSGELRWVEHKTIHLFLEGRRLPYPLRAPSLLRLPPRRLLAAASGYLQARLSLGAAPEARTYQAWFEQRFGAELYRWIAGPLMRKQWGLTGAELDAAFGLHRRLTMDLRDLVGDWPLLSRLVARRMPRGFFYGRQGAGALMAALATRFRALGGEIRLGVRPRRLLCRDGRVTSLLLDDGQRLELGEAGCLCSTIPLPALLGLFDPPVPGAHPEDAAALAFRALVVGGLVLDRERFSPDHVTYFPEEGFPFSRTFEPKNACPALGSPGRTVLGFEIPCMEGDQTYRLPEDDLVRRLTAFGPRLGFTQDEVVEGFVARVPDAYPIYRTGYGQPLAAILAALHHRLENLFLVGRNALFRLDNMNHAFTMGFDLASLLAQGQSPRAWHIHLPRYEDFSYID